MTKQRGRMGMVPLALAMAIGLAGAALAGPTPADKCEASKNKTAGAYYSCLEKAEATAITKALPADYSKCTAKFDDKWDKAETSGDGDCPDTVLTAPMNAFIAAQAADAAAVIAGGAFPGVCGDGLVAGGEECDDGDLNGATCATQGFAGGTLTCSFCTFDESGCYATRFDASGATIIDHQTGLEWEKKDSADGAISPCPGGPTCANAHDVDNYYAWSSTGTAPDGVAFTDFLAKLNGGTSSGGPTTGCYAGHCDWRLPTLEELQGVPWPAGPEFEPYIASSYYWSVSILAGNPAGAWSVGTASGIASANLKTGNNYVRAVRSGS